MRDITQIDNLKALRAPIDAKDVEKLPRYAGPRGTPKKDRKYADCEVCGKNHVVPAVHLDYLGHAGTTERLLSVDPLWNWEPCATEDDGRPKFERTSEGLLDALRILSKTIERVIPMLRSEVSMPAGLDMANELEEAVQAAHDADTGDSDPVGFWAKLTICGVTRLAYGSCEAGKGDPEKELIGDMVRNGAMRFGVATALWKGSTDTERVGVDGKLPADKRKKKAPDKNVRKYEPPDMHGIKSLNCTCCGAVFEKAELNALQKMYAEKPSAKPHAYNVGDLVIYCATEGCGWIQAAIVPAGK